MYMRRKTRILQLQYELVCLLVSHEIHGKCDVVKKSRYKDKEAEDEYFSNNEIQQSCLKRHFFSGPQDSPCLEEIQQMILGVQSVELKTIFFSREKSRNPFF